MNFKNVKVGARLLAGFGTVVVALLVVVAAGLFGLRTLHGTIDHLSNDLFPKTVTANNVIGDVNIVARATRNILLVADKSDMDKEFERVKVARARISKEFAELDQRIKSPAGRAVLATAVAARATYVQSLDAFLKLTQDNKFDDARTLLLTQVRGAQQGYLDAIGKLIEFQSELMDQAGKDAGTLVSSLQVTLLAVGAIATLLAIAIALVITRSITRPLQRAVGVAEAVAAGDLTQQIESHSRDETGQLLAALGKMNDKLRSVIGQIRVSTEAVGSASQQIATGNADLSQRTEEQASSLEETASSMEELTSTVKQNADNARQANQLAASASEVATKGGAVVGEVVSTMGAISDASKRIGDIIGVIDGIAFQTNILALNAAVEAARAGEQGRGFAVVAAEVRTLAQRSAAAAKEIKDLIGDSVTKVDAGSKLVADAGTTMAEVVASVKRVTDIMAEITAATLEQSSGIEQVNQAIVQMDQVTQQNAALVEESAAAAESMAQQARELAGAVAVFKVADGGGVSAMTTAAAGSTTAVAMTKAVPATAGWNGGERRGPNRATNVTRPKFGARAQPAKTTQSTPIEARRTGTDNEWAEF